MRVVAGERMLATMGSSVRSRGFGIVVGVVAATLAVAACNGGNAASSGNDGAALSAAQVTRLNKARLQSFVMVGVWDHLNDHCRKAYGPPQPSNPYKSPKATPQQARRMGHCMGQLYHWLGVQHAVMAYARTLQALEGNAHGKCKALLGSTSERLSAFAGALEQISKDLAGNGRSRKQVERDSAKFHQVDVAFQAEEKTMMSACHVTPQP